VNAPGTLLDADYSIGNQLAHQRAAIVNSAGGIVAQVSLPGGMIATGMTSDGKLGADSVIFNVIEGSAP